MAITRLSTLSPPLSIVSGFIPAFRFITQLGLEVKSFGGHFGLFSKDIVNWYYAQPQLIEQRLPSSSVSPLKAKRGDILRGLDRSHLNQAVCSEQLEASLSVGFLAVLAMRILISGCSAFLCSSSSSFSASSQLALGLA